VELVHEKPAFCQNCSINVTFTFSFFRPAVHV
jgi:hypothetical protein